MASPDLLAADGSRLGKELKQKVFSGELKPVVGSPLRAACCRAKDRPRPAGGLGDVPRSTSSSLRVREKDLPTFFSQYRRGGRRGSWKLSSDYEAQPDQQAGEPVYVNRIHPGGKKRAGADLPADPGHQGTAGAACTSPCSSAPVTTRRVRYRVLLSVSDIGLHTRAYKDKLFVHTAASRTARR